MNNEFNSLANPEKDAYVLNEWLAISDTEKTISTIRELSSSDITEADIKDRVHFLSNVVCYLTSDLRPTTRERALFAWIDSGVKNEYGEIIWLHCIKSYGVFYCKLVGNGAYLAYKVGKCSPFPLQLLRKNTQELLTKYQKSESLTNKEPSLPETDPLVMEIKNKLLFDNWKTPEGLRIALLIYGARAQELIDKKHNDFFVKNNKGSIIINTGLLDKFGEPIYVMYRHNLTKNTYVPYLYITNKSQYIENDFSKEDASKILRPISFDEPETTPFSTNLMDYDTNFEHCVSERRERFPDSVKEATDLYIAQRLRSELELGLKIHKSGGYAKPNYKPKEQELQWLLPLHINTAIQEEPELVMAIRRRNGFYEVATILAYDDSIKDKIRAVQPYENLW